MEITSERFKAAAADALTKPQLKVALNRTTGLLIQRRAEAYAGYAEFEAARDVAARIKDHTLEYLDYYLELFEKNALASGAKVHWAQTAEEACAITVEICKSYGARSVTRVKSMLGEELGLPHALEAAGIERIETDLAEHIIQLAHERPSHIVMPAMHKTHEEVGELFKTCHAEPQLSDNIGEMVESARRFLRPRYVAADVGISGANFLIADTGSICTVTNEGNAELTTALPKVHIVTVGIEKLVPSMHHATAILRLLARSATGAEITQYTTFYNGPKRAGDHDGPDDMHIILVDHHRTDMLGNELKDMLRCIRCGACMNHCPVYGQIGGHAYGSVYPGPMGSVLTPAMASLKATKDLPNACTLNGRCAEVCPVKIPLTDLMRGLRAQQWREGLIATPWRTGLKIWAWWAKRPAWYRAALNIKLPMLGLLTGGKGKLGKWPLTGGWTASRDLPAPAKRSFLAQVQARRPELVK
ncbi:MAG: lactate utilization protein B [Geminicoccaceae bacterium]